MISTRRSILAALLASPVLGLTEINLAAADTTLGLDLTPDCHDGDERTWLRQKVLTSSPMHLSSATLPLMRREAKE